MSLDIVDWLDAEGTPEAHAARDEIEHLRGELCNESMRAEGEYMRAYAAEAEAREFAELLRESRDALEQLLVEATDLLERFSDVREADGWDHVKEEPCFDLARKVLKKATLMLGD